MHPLPGPMRPLVLICDDDRLVCSALSRELAARNVATLVDITSSAHRLAPLVRPAAILLDLRQSKHGLEILRDLRRNPSTAQIPVVIYSASLDPFHEQEARRLGISGFVH